MIIIDVRTKEEYENDHIDGAINHDIVNIFSGIFPPIDKYDDVLLYCESGNRSMMAKELMEKEGFKNIKDAGGIDNLRK